MDNPLIGVTTSHTTNFSGVLQTTLPAAYSQALIDAGACPLLIPSGLPEPALDTLFHSLDGLLFSGGGDVHPEIYRSKMHPLVSEVDSDRDRLEVDLIQQAVNTHLPFLGICRGLQVINVALGGTLYEDIHDQRPGSLPHQYSPDYPRDYLAHEVIVQQESQLAFILGSTQLQVNSLHHQGIRDMAGGLRAVAHSPDGLIEAIELPGHPFGLAVQWHPECLQNHPEMRAFFCAFTEAAAKGRS